MELNDVTGEIVSAAMKVHTSLGPGLLESAYKTCLDYELTSRGVRVARECQLPISYCGNQLDIGYRIDLLVEDSVIVEVKAARANPLYEAQLLSYLKLSGCRIGLLLNFWVPSVKDGIKRMIN